MRWREKGVTLIELMIVVVIVGIISAIAYPSYQQSMIRANQVEARTALLENMHFLEQFYASRGTYANGSVWPSLPVRQTPSTGNPVFNLAFSTSAPTAIANDRYILRATPADGVALAGEETIEVNQYGEIKRCTNTVQTSGSSQTTCKPF